MEAILKELSLQKSSPMLSLVISSKVKSFAEQSKVKLKLKNQLSLAAKKLQAKHDEETARKMLNKAKAMANQIDWKHLENGLGLYVSPDYSTLVSFPFEVKDKCVVDDTFEISDLQNTLDKMVAYSVVLVSKHFIRLFKGQGNKLEEISDNNFPLQFEDQFQVSRTSPHSYYNMEESEIDQARLDNYYRKAENLLKPYVKQDPVVLMGTGKSLANFKGVGKYKFNILAENTGNFDRYKTHEVLAKVWPDVKKYSEKSAIKSPV